MELLFNEYIQVFIEYDGEKVTVMVGYITLWVYLISLNCIIIAKMKNMYILPQ